MLEDVCARGHYKESAKASAHMDGSALERRVDIFGSRGTFGFVVEKELHGQAGIMNSAADGSLWLAARLNV